MVGRADPEKMRQLAIPCEQSGARRDACSTQMFSSIVPFYLIWRSSPWMVPPTFQVGLSGNPLTDVPIRTSPR